jgi:DNA-binding NarL/FixJ family response regulator
MYSILIIEDDPAYTSMMEIILQIEGYEVRTASDGKSGLVMLREKRPDLILCDIMMPEIDGHMVLEILKGERALADIPFIFVTAMGERADVRLGMSAGADDYLSKPFTTFELLTAVAGRIRRHEMIHHNRRESDFQEEKNILRQKITKREREILLMVGRGSTSREIAERLAVSIKTVETHRANLMKKLDAGNAATLARWSVISEEMEKQSQ